MLLRGDVAERKRLTMQPALLKQSQRIPSFQAKKVQGMVLSRRLLCQVPQLLGAEACG